jgi:hypothetical protein
MQPARQTARVSDPARSVIPPTIKRFQAAERLLAFDNGRLEVIHFGSQAIGKGSYAPGWRWSRCTGPPVATQRVTGDHVGLVLSGLARLRVHDGLEIDLRPGDCYQAALSAEFDMWVVGFRPCEILYLAGVESLIEQLHPPV